MSDFNDKLVLMANQIAAAFSSDGAEASQETAAHLEAFWPPPMRARIVAHLEAGGDGLSEGAVAAIRRLRSPIASTPTSTTPTPSRSPAGGPQAD